MRFLIDENLTPLTNEELIKELQTVSNQRREKIMKMRFDAGKMQSLRAYKLLQRLLFEEYGISTPPVFLEQGNGKPVIADHEDIHFNISHCKNSVACAISNTPIGIDIEIIGRKSNNSLIKYIFNEYEQQMIFEAGEKDNSNPKLASDIMFTNLWTKKEALVKMTGEGISGKEQLVPLLEDWHRGKSSYDFITEYSPEDKWVCSICYPKE